MSRLTWIACLLGGLVVGCGDGEPPACVDACAAPGTSCDGAAVVVCEAGPDGCLVASPVDCEAAGLTCVAAADGSAQCGANCADSCPVAGMSCEGDVLVACVLASNGCLTETGVDCSDRGQYCDHVGGEPACADVCSDDPSCSDVGQSCQGHVLVDCTISELGCLLATETDCAGTADPVCDPARGCVAQGDGDSCASPFVVQGADATIAGADFFSDYSDTQSFDGVGCVAAPGAPELIIEVQLGPGDLLHVSEHGELDAILAIAGSCGDGAACSLASDDEAEGILLENASAGPIAAVVVVTTLQSGGAAAYDVQIDVTPAVCGDGVEQSNEACDDGNAQGGDGCSANCQTVEPGFTCIPGQCFTSDTGDVCGDPIVLDAPQSLSMTTADYNDDYSDYTGCNASGGVGPDVVYRYDVLPGHVLEVSTLVENGFGLAVAIADDCPNVTGSCLTYNAAGAGSAAEWINDTASVKSVFVVADSSNALVPEAGGFTVAIDHRPLVCGDGFVDGDEVCDDGNAIDDDDCTNSCQQRGDLCVAPLGPLQVGLLSATTIGFADDYDDYSACPGGSSTTTGDGPEVVYSFIIPPGMVLDAQLVGSVNLALALVSPTAQCDALDATTCLGVSDPPDSPTLESLRYSNVGGVDEEVLIIVDGSNFFAGAFDLTLSLEAPMCGDGMIEGSEECDDGGNQDLDGCGADCAIEPNATCFSEPSRCYFVTGDSCDSIALPPPTVGSGTYHGNTEDPFFTDVYATNVCPGAFNGNTGVGPDQVFHVALPDGATLSAALDSLGPNNADLGVFFVLDNAATGQCSSIDATSCVAGADQLGGFGVEMTNYTNDTGQLANIYVIVDGFAGDSGPFSLALTVQ